MRGEAPIGVIAIAEELVPLSVAVPGLDYWVLINDAIEGNVQIDSLHIEEQQGDGISRASATVLNPTTLIQEGKTFKVVWRDEVVFAGIVRTVTIESDQSETVLVYKVEADGWDSILARHTVTKTYANKTAGFILRDVIALTGLDLDGVTAGVIDEGPTLIQVQADHVRVGDFIRDVGGAGGGLAYIDPYKRIQFNLALQESDVEVTSARCEKITHQGDIDSYRNRQIVKVTGLDGVTTVTEQRDDLAQQALRIDDEGGSGIYEAYEEVKHPTSSISGELSVLGQTVAFVDLRTFARNARKVTVTMRDPAPAIGELTIVNLPGYTLSGEFVVMRKVWRDVGGQFLFDIEFWESSFQQRALESLLRIVGAGKASVSIAASVFPNSTVFSTAGTTTWTVPVGVTSVQFTAYGASGGGGGGLCSSGGPFFFGGRGGTSGRALTIMAVVAGQVFDLVIGAKGAGGVGAQDGFPGHDTTVTLTAVLKCRGDKSLGGKQVKTSPSCATGAKGANGSGFGDAVVDGGGVVGGAGSTISTNGQPGLDGFIEVRW